MYRFSNILKTTVVLTLLFASFSFGAIAQNKSTKKTATQLVDTDIKALGSKYENTEGVDVVVCEDNFELKLFKMMLRNEFGRDFLKGVNVIIIIDYTKASADVATAISNEAKKLATKLTVVDTKDEKSDEGTMECFIAPVDGNEDSITDFLLIDNGKDLKCVFYFGGLITADPSIFD